MVEITASGRVVEDVEMKYTGKGVPALEFRIGTSGYFEKKKVSMFFDVVQYGAHAEELAGKIKKGVMVVVQGRYRGDVVVTGKGRKYKHQKIYAGSVEVVLPEAMEMPVDEEKEVKPATPPAEEGDELKMPDEE